MIFDLHVHTRTYSRCSNIEPLDLIKKAVALGLDGICLTEHGIRWPEERIAQLLEEAGNPDLTVFAGQEIRCVNRNYLQQGEFIVFGVRESLGANLSARELIKSVHKENGIVIAAHPFKPTRHGGIGFHGAGKLIYELDLDAIELYHPDHTGEYMEMAFEAVKKLNLPGTGGSDAHNLEELGMYVTKFSGPIRTETELVSAIRQGRFDVLTFQEWRNDKPAEKSG